MRVLKLSSAAVIVMLPFFASLPCASTPPSKTISLLRCGVPPVSKLGWLGFGGTIRAIVPSSGWIAKSVDQGLKNRILFETKKKSSPPPPSVCTDEEIVNKIMEEASQGITFLRGKHKDFGRISKFKTILRDLVQKSVMERRKKPKEEDYRKPSACEKMEGVNDWLTPFQLSRITVNSICKELLKEIYYEKHVSLHEILVHAKM